MHAPPHDVLAGDIRYIVFALVMNTVRNPSPSMEVARSDARPHHSMVIRGNDRVALPCHFIPPGIQLGQGLLCTRGHVRTVMWVVELQNLA